MIHQKLLRPEPLFQPAATGVDKTTPPEKAARRLLEGATLRITDAYRTGEAILAQLEGLLPEPEPSAPYPLRQAHRRRLREASLRLLAPIQGHRLTLQGAGEIELLPELYPERTPFFLPFVQVQELYGASVRYREGIPLAVLGYRLHPYFGTYVPTRVSHLELFATWLRAYTGPRARAVDVGTGCGVLALMLMKAGFQQIMATDTNPNALESVARELKRREQGQTVPNRPGQAPAPASHPATVPSVSLHCCDLLEGISAPADLLVFNPPWMKGTPDVLLDTALYFEDGLFERFFEQALTRLTPEGRVVLIFSNVMELVQPAEPHPIVTELERGRFRLVQKQHRKVEGAQLESGQRRRTRERVEVWELARA